MEPAWCSASMEMVPEEQMERSAQMRSTMQLTTVTCAHGGSRRSVRTVPPRDKASPGQSLHRGSLAAPHDQQTWERTDRYALYLAMQHALQCAHRLVVVLARVQRRSNLTARIRQFLQVWGQPSGTGPSCSPNTFISTYHFQPSVGRCCAK
jgi:hypothetical protein